MSEYLIQGETLTGIADKIRPLLGLTGTMTPEQMQTNLTTEQSNITAALAALAEKGVEVPEGANSNALAGLIAAIEAGGGFATGTITTAKDYSSLVYIGSNNNRPSDNVYLLYVEHDLGSNVHGLAFIAEGGAFGGTSKYPHFGRIVLPTGSVHYTGDGYSTTHVKPYITRTDECFRATFNFDNYAVLNASCIGPMNGEIPSGSVLRWFVW